MKIVIAGGTGFLGGALVRALAAGGHDIVVLTRRHPPGMRSPSSDPARGDDPGVGGRQPGDAARIAHVGWAPDGTAGAWTPALDGADAVVNLAGESIAARRWTARQKARIRESRILATRSLAAAFRLVAPAPRVLVSGSAVGYYGSRGDERLTDSSPPGNDFLAELCVEWEKEAGSAAAAGARVTLVRTGLVLAADGGALPQMLLPFRLFAGGPLGPGHQYMPWIHRDDWVALVAWLLRTDGAAGPFNATAPEPVSNAEFMRALGVVLHRPSWLPAPAFALRLALGEMADALLLSGQRAVPARAQALGFEFKYTDLRIALREAITKTQQ